MLYRARSWRASRELVKWARWKILQEIIVTFSSDSRLFECLVHCRPVRFRDLAAIRTVRTIGFRYSRNTKFNLHIESRENRDEQDEDVDRSRIVGGCRRFCRIDGQRTSPSHWANRSRTSSGCPSGGSWPCSTAHGATSSATSSATSGANGCPTGGSNRPTRRRGSCGTNLRYGCDTCGSTSSGSGYRCTGSSLLLANHRDDSRTPSLRAISTCSERGSINDTLSDNI